MNDEIKEKKTKRLIEKIEGLTIHVVKPGELSIYNYLTIDSEEAKLLIDYITNLQQENERLKEKSINETLKNDFDMCVKDLKKANKKIEKLEDYKSRCEKAVEYIEDVMELTKECPQDLLDILNGRSDE